MSNATPIDLPEAAPISVGEAQQLIERENLQPAYGAWHYSFDLERYHASLLDLLPGRASALAHETPDGALVVRAKAPLHRWAPLPVFAPAGYAPDLPLHNALTEGPTDRKERYWLLRLTSWEDFLARRSAMSNKPKWHFPSLESYARETEKYPAQFVVEPYDQGAFVRAYETLRRPNHITGQQVVQTFKKTTGKQALDLLQTAHLVHDGKKVATALFVDDGRSISAVNIASEIEKAGWGVRVFVELVRHYAERGYDSLDGGVSGSYGGYKKKIFLDTMHVH